MVRGTDTSPAKDSLPISYGGVSSAIWDVGRKSVASVNTAEYDLLIEILKAARLEAGLGQETLSKKLGYSPSFMFRVEDKQRRLDVVEFSQIAAAIGLTAQDLLERWESLKASRL